MRYQQSITLRHARQKPQRKKNEEAGQVFPALLCSPLGDEPASLTEGDWLVVCWPECRNRRGAKSFGAGAKKLSRIVAGRAGGGRSSPLMARSSNLSPENLLRFLQVKSNPVSAEESSPGRCTFLKMSAVRFSRSSISSRNATRSKSSPADAIA